VPKNTKKNHTIYFPIVFELVPTYPGFQTFQKKYGNSHNKVGMA